MRGFERRLLAGENAVTLWRLAAAAPRSWQIVSAVRPHAAVGGGGYLSGPVVAAAALRRVPALAIESDAHLGVTNRLLAPLVSRVCLSFPIEGREPPRFVVTGRPLAAAAARRRRSHREGRLRSDGRAAGRARLRRQPGRAEPQPRLPRGVRLGARSTCRCCTSADRATSTRCRRPWSRARPTLSATGCCPTLRTWRTPWPPPTWSSGAPVVRWPRSPRWGAPPSWSPTRTPPPTTRARTRPGWPPPAPLVVVADADLDGRLLAGLVGELLADETRLARMAAASRAAGRRDATQAVADEVESLLARSALRPRP